MAKKALITGVTGQDGSYLADFLLEKGYEVYGMVRRSSMEKFDRIEHIKDRINIRQADLLDQYSISKIIEEVQPDEVYNLAAMSFVPTSWDQPVLRSTKSLAADTRTASGSFCFMLPEVSTTSTTSMLSAGPWAATGAAGMIMAMRQASAKARRRMCFIGPENPPPGDHSRCVRSRRGADRPNRTTWPNCGISRAARSNTRGNA